jgi:nucleolar complex protein 2
MQSTKKTNQTQKHNSTDDSATDDADDDAAAAAAGDSVAADNQKLRGSVARHKAQLEALAQRDPEFYAYLQQSDAELLGFGEGEGSEEEEEDDDDDDDDEEESEEEEAAVAAGKKKKAKAGKKGGGADDESEEEEEGSEEEEGGDDDEEEEGGSGKKRKAAVNVTSAVVEDWCGRALETASLTAMKQLLKAYRWGGVLRGSRIWGRWMEQVSPAFAVLTAPSHQ